MAISFPCPRCGRHSYSPDDIRAGYCGSCHGWTGLGPPGVRVLDPAALLWDPRWTYEYTAADGQSATFSWNPQAGSDVAEWRPAVQLGSFTATRDRDRDRCILTVGTEPLCREILERTGLSARSWSWDELRRIAGVISRAAEDTGVPEIASADFGPLGPLTRDLPDADPLADLQEARRLIEAAGAVSGVLEALSAAGVSASAGFGAGLDEEQYEAARRAMEQWTRDRELADARAARRPPRSSRDRRARARRVLDDAEALIARLDGEGYGVAAKARVIEAAEITTPPGYLDRDHAMSWRPGDPAL
jgi:hypothetical protein